MKKQLAGAVLSGLFLVLGSSFGSAQENRSDIRVVVNMVQLNVAVTDNATTGLHVGSGTTGGVVLRNVYAARNGMLGISATYADRLLMEKVVSENNNTEHFNKSPVSGGAKITRSRVVVVRDSMFRGNDGPGLWMDESDYDMTITGNEMRNNSGHGASLEISAKALFADNIVTNNGGFGVKINNTSNVSAWNNTFVGNDRSLNLVQDARRPTSATTAGRDPRQPFPDPTMTWLIGPAVFSNNVVASQRSGNCMVCVEDYTRQRSAAQIGVRANGDLYNRPNSSTPTNLVVWSRGASDPATYASLSTFKAATGQEAAGQQLTGTGLVDGDGQLLTALSTSAVPPLPASVAAAIGFPAGSRHVGAFPH